MKLLFWRKPKCSKGHKLVKGNLYYHVKKKDGRIYQECRTCNLQRTHNRYMAKRNEATKWL